MQNLSSPKLSSPIDLIKKSFEIFFVRENLIFFVSIYLLILPFQIFSYFQSSLFDSNTMSFKNPQMIWVVTVVNVLYFAVYLITSLAGLYAVKNVVEDKHFTFQETFSIAWKNLWKFLLMSSLVFLAVLGGSILLLIPGIIFGLWFAFSKFVFVDQGLVGKACLAKSHELVKGRFWAVLGRLFVFGLFLSLVEFTVLIIPYGVGSMILALAGALFILPSYLLYKELLSDN